MVAAVLTTLTLLVAAPIAHNNDDWWGGVGSFRPIANFNVPGATTAEIISVSRDGRFLVYSDAIGQKFGLVNITNPAAPHQVSTLAAGGDPTSVVVLPVGNLAVGAVQPGKLVLIDLSTFTIAATRAIGTGPDSVAVTRIGGQVVAVIAIENEGAEKGFVEVVRLDLSSAAAFAASPGAKIEFSDPLVLTAAGLLAVDDPQPEFVSIRGTKVAVTLQENNGIAIIDISNPGTPVLEELFSAGKVEDRRADLQDDSKISFTETYPADVEDDAPNAGVRIPDAIGWSPDGTTLFTADEGEEAYEGGRGFSAHGVNGAVLFDDGGSLEATAVRFGHYPDGRSDAKGIEAEGLAVATFGHQSFLFVSSERGAFVAVYRLDGWNRPHFVQLLSTGQGPEGVLPIPSRNLLVTANEGDDENGTISIFQGVHGKWEGSFDRPTISSKSVDEPWGALSGLAASPFFPNVLYAVPDSALPSSIFSLIVFGPEAKIHERVPVTREGQPVQYDLEGITIDTSIKRPRWNAGFWLASEGDADETKNTLIQVNGRGEVLREIFLPTDIDAPGERIQSNGFEGVAVSGNGRYLLVAIQRPFVGDVKVAGKEYTRIARYDLHADKWESFFYPLELFPGTIGLSEIALVGRTKAGADVYAVIERDNRLAAPANLKRIYSFTLEGLGANDIGTLVNATSIVGTTVTKALVSDLLPTFSPYEKVEGLTRSCSGTPGSCWTTMAASSNRASCACANRRVLRTLPRLANSPV